MMKKQSDCLHMSLERIKEEVKTIDVKSLGTLRPVFKCGDCGTLFYLVMPVEKKL